MSPPTATSTPTSSVFRFWTELFTNGDNGRAGAIVVMLMIAIVPVMIYQVHHFREQEAQG